MVNTKHLIMGNKIPAEYFYTKGHGQSNYGGKGQPYEAGSYDAALNMAKIEQANVMFYTSLIPPGAEEVTRAKGVNSITWGRVIDCIMAKFNGTHGQKITASVLATAIYNDQGKFMGHFACEYAGYGSEEDAIETLLHDVTEMIERRGWGTPLSTARMRKLTKTSKGWSFKPERIHSETLKVTKKYGSVLAAICFTKYYVPIE